MTKSAVAFLVVAGLTLVPPAAAASDARPGVTVSTSVAVALSAPLSELAEEAALAESDQESGELREINNQALPHKGDATAPFGGPVVDPVRQTSFPPNISPNVLTDPIANFEGIGVNGSIPPDTNGAVGPNHYVQTVNTRVEVWDKNGNVLVASTPINTLFSTLPGGDRCNTNNDGDPVVLYDQLADRFMISQFAVLPFPGTHEYNQCIAVSKTGDPTGSYWVYDFVWATNRLNDYPHFGIWPDGYYMTMHQFDATSQVYQGAGIAVYERDAMLSGLTAQQIRFDTGTQTLDYGGHLPADLEGSTLPAVGAPNHVFEWDNAGWLGDPVDTIRIWNVHVDWTTPANSTFGANAQFDPDFTLQPADATVLSDSGEPCFNTRNCIPQPSTAQKLDAISDGRLMYRASDRFLSGHESVLIQNTVDAGSGIAGPRWIEIRGLASGSPAIFQQGTFSPDSTHRWMGSVAMDKLGDIALGYSMASSALFPSIGYTGRKDGDTPGLMTLGEKMIQAGAGSQTSTSARWGDYSEMNVDPSDDCTFWYTNEYFTSTSSGSWHTRIGSFHITNCLALFEDGFESGDTSAWSAVVP
jgi:hypothetical protein